MACLQPLMSLYCTLRIEVCNWWGWGQWLALGAALPLRAQCQSRPPRFRLLLLVLVVGGLRFHFAPESERSPRASLWGGFRWVLLAPSLVVLFSLVTFARFLGSRLLPAPFGRGAVSPRNRPRSPIIGSLGNPPRS